MAIDRKKACITIIAGGSWGSREDREDRSRVFWDEVKWDYNFFCWYLGRLWSDFQTVFRKMMGIHSWLQSLCHIRLKYIYFFFMLRITAFPHLFLSLYICFKCKSTWGLQSQLHLLSSFICKYIQADWSMLRIFWISRTNNSYKNTIFEP